MDTGLLILREDSILQTGLSEHCRLVKIPHPEPQSRDSHVRVTWESHALNSPVEHLNDLDKVSE